MFVLGYLGRFPGLLGLLSRRNIVGLLNLLSCPLIPAGCTIRGYKLILFGNELVQCARCRLGARTPASG